MEVNDNSLGPRVPENSCHWCHYCNLIYPKYVTDLKGEGKTGFKHGDKDMPHVNQLVKNHVVICSLRYLHVPVARSYDFHI